MRAGAAGRTVRQAIRRAGNAVSRALRADRVATGSQHFNVEHAALGMSPWTHRIAACLDYPAIVERRRRNFAELLGQLRGVTPPIFTHLPAGVCPLFYPMRVPDKPRLLGRLLARGVEAVDFWGLGHPALPTGTFSEADDLRRSVLELPCHQSLTPRAIRRMAAIVREELAR
jgi:dTDP-4-amino-4,6-dideoxygalactose transaminase